MKPQIIERSLGEVTSSAVAPMLRTDSSLFDSPTPAEDLQRAVDCILDDCFISIGQAVGTRTTVDYDAVVWLRERFRAKFIASMKRQGNRWMQDRPNVTAVCALLAERAVRYAGDATSINVDAARKAAADVERYCQLHARRRAQANGLPSDDAPTRIAGYWCAGPAD